MKKISVIVPVYNVEKYLRQCIESILMQTYRNLEILLIDDGSTDKSREICDEYAKKDHRIKVIHQKNMGAANAKNVGLEVMTGDFFTFVDSDDWIDVTMLQNVMREQEVTNADIIGYGLVNEYLDRSEFIPINNPRHFTAEQYIKKMCIDWTGSLMTNKVFFSELSKNIRFRKERRCIDDEFYTYKVILQAEKIVELEECYYHYRMRLSSVTKSDKSIKQILRDRIDFITERYEYVKHVNTSLSKEILDHLVNIYLGVFGDSELENELINLMKNNLKILLGDILLSDINLKRKLKLLSYLVRENRSILKVVHKKQIVKVHGLYE